MNLPKHGDEPVPQNKALGQPGVVIDLCPSDPAGMAAWEARRVAALKATGLLDTTSDPAFDDLTELAAQFCETQVALIVLVDTERLWFKSVRGTDLREYPRAGSFCDTVIRGDGVFVVPDLTQDPRFADSEIVRETGLRFYASATIHAPGGIILGTLAVLDKKARTLSPAQADALLRLARQCDNLIALKGLLRDLERQVSTRTQALRSTEARLSAFMQNAPITMSVKDLDGHYLLVNRASERFYGRPASDMIGRRIADIELSEGARAIDELEVEMRRAGRSVTREIAYPRDGGTRWYRDIKFPIPDETGAIGAIGGIGIDITATKLVQEELIEAKEHAEAASQAKSQFLANMSHELRTPLNAILGFSEILAGSPLGPLTPERVQTYAADIHESGRLLLNIINDILDLSKIEAGRLVLTDGPCDLGAIARNALNLVANAAQAKSLRLLNNLPDNLPPIRADERALTQILINLLNNAVKFTLPGGEIRIEAGLVNHGERGDGIAIAVSDTGIGIANEDIPLVFSAFGQVQDAFVRAHEGAGLGLPIARALTEAQGGRLDLHSRLGQGTRVTLWLPKERVLAA
ncbi:ATP-binding protein [Dongia sp.]|uniref:sensor histidine kinase n=1 Tax=Dongia sp. TaxID=1977262 RepID=UPI0035B1C2DC